MNVVERMPGAATGTICRKLTKVAVSNGLDLEDVSLLGNLIKAGIDGLQEFKDLFWGARRAPLGETNCDGEINIVN